MGAANPARPFKIRITISIPPVERGTIIFARRRRVVALHIFSPLFPAFLLERYTTVPNAKANIINATIITLERFAGVPVVPDILYEAESGLNPKTRYATRAPASAYIPAITPERPERDRNL